MRMRCFRACWCVAMLLAWSAARAAQEFRATVKGQVVDSSKAALPGATVTVRNQETNEVATATTNTDGNYTVPFLRPGIYTLTVEMSGFQKYTRSDMRLEVSQVARDQRAARRRRRDRKRERLRRIAAARNEQGRSRHGHRPGTHRGAAAPVAQPDGARDADRRRHLQRAGHLPPSVRQRRAGRLVDERRAEPQQRIPARRRAQQREPGRQQHRLRPSGRCGAGVQDADELLRRAVRPDGRRRHEHVAEVGHQLLPRHRLRVLPAQVARRELVPAERAQHAEGGALPRSVRIRDRRPGEDSRPLQRHQQDVLHVQRREIPRGHAGRAVQQRADARR